jgi:hypothetical protein
MVILIVSLCEGLASMTLFFQEVSQTNVLTERRHTQYDELLGWINIPNIYIKDMYGANVYLRTNSQSFRNNEDFTVSVPPHKVRIICSGDSFTFGYSVDNEHTWCQLLSSKDNRLQTVNMGQGGYGIDQAYLWYKRDGSKLDHDVHIFAFITSDFKRMQRIDFNGYGKPLLKWQNEALVATNVPVPSRPFYTPWLTQNKQTIDELKSVQLLNSLFFEGAEEAEAEADDPSTAEDASPEVIALKILEDLIQLNQAKNSTLVLVYLPGQNFTGADMKHWRQQVHLASQKHGIIFFDLIDEFKGLSADELAEMFIQEEQAKEYNGSAGHYTIKGNQYVADVLYEKLLALPEISNRLAAYPKQ